MSRLSPVAAGGILPSCGVQVSQAVCFLVKHRLYRAGSVVVVSSVLPLQEAQVQFLVRELRSHVPHGAAKEKKGTAIKNQAKIPGRICRCSPPAGRAYSHPIEGRLDLVTCSHRTG